MNNRKPLEMRKILVVYNFIQTIFSAWLFYEVSFIYIILITIEIN